MDDQIIGITDWRGDILSTIRNTFLKADTGIVEEWKWIGSPAWSREGLIAACNAHKDKVKVTFSQGANLSDPESIFNAGLGGKKRHGIDIYENDDLDEFTLRDMVRRAIK